MVITVLLSNANFSEDKAVEAPLCAPHFVGSLRESAHGCASYTKHSGLPVDCMKDLLLKIFSE